MPDDRDRMLVGSVLTWSCTGGLVLVVGWAFSVGGDLRALSGLPARVASLESRINQIEREAARDAEALSALRDRLDRLQVDQDRMRQHQ